MDLGSSLKDSIEKIRQTRPLVLNVTNYVAMDFSANALLALGASPIMSCSKEEFSELVQIAQTVVVNMGTFDASWIACANATLKAARENNKPIIFDPVGVGASRERTALGRNIFSEYEPDIIRGNASEIETLLTENSSARGVDSTISSDRVLPIAREAASTRKTVFVISGKTDFVIGKNRRHYVKNGDPRMTRVTAMGCSTTSIIGAFRAVHENSAEAALMAMSLVGLCGELASGETKGPGSLRTVFLDLLGSEGLPFERLRVGTT